MHAKGSSGQGVDHRLSVSSNTVSLDFHHVPGWRGERESFSPLIKEESESHSLCPTLWDPMDYTVHGILRARILEWAAFPFSRGSSQPRD